MNAKKKMDLLLREKINKIFINSESFINAFDYYLKGQLLIIEKLNDNLFDNKKIIIKRLQLTKEKLRFSFLPSEQVYNMYKPVLVIDDDLEQRYENLKELVLKYDGIILEELKKHQ